MDELFSGLRKIGRRIREIQTLTPQMLLLRDREALRKEERELYGRVETLQAEISRKKNAAQEGLFND